jgi:4-alpha-glucanotransferase
MRAITLVPVFHDSQAPGRSAAALDAFVAEAWGPLIDALFAAPRVRCGLVLSGALARHLADHAPERFARMRELSARGQVEIIGGTANGAALHLVPERDAVGQLRQHQRWLRTRLGVPVRGVWPTLSAWDPAVPRIVARAGGAYTFVDAGLVAAGGAMPAAGGWLVTERLGATMATVPLDHALGDRLPFVDPDALVAGLRGRCDAGRRVLCVPISVEALGRSDEARDWCFGGASPWVPGLFTALVQHAAWLKTAVPWQLVDRTPAAGRAWPASGTPGAGAADMLPDAAARTWVQVQRALVDDPSPALAGLAPYLHGPPLEAALSRYDVAARLHRAGLRASMAVATLRREAQAASRPAGPVEAAAARLAEGQAALGLDPRLGGGLREPGVRHAAFSALVDAELHALAQSTRGPPAVENVDAGPDGHPEVVLRRDGVRLIVRPGVGGAISELALEGVGNFVNTLARTPEHWHAELGEDTAMPILVDEPADAAPSAPPPLEDYDEDEPTDFGQVGGADATPSPNGVRMETPRIDRDACLRAADAVPRLLLQDRLLGETTTLDALARGQHEEQGDLALAPYRLERAQAEADGSLVVLMGRDGRVRQGLEEDRLLGVLKRVSLGAAFRRVDARWDLQNRSKTPIQSTFSAELNLCLDGGLGPDRLLHVAGLDPVRLDTAFVARGANSAQVIFGSANVQIRTPDIATLYHYPLYVPGRRGGRVVPTYQGLCLHVAWPLSLWGGERVSFSLSLTLGGAG